MGAQCWTKEQDAFLAEHRSIMLSADLAEAINDKFGTSYSKKAVIGRAHRLGLALDKNALMKATGISWKPEHDEFLCARRADMPLKELVELINWTFGTKYSLHSIKNSVARLGLAGKGRRYQHAAPAKPRAVPVRAATVTSHRKTIVELKALECRWPDEEPHPETGWHTFCGHRTADRSSYCPEHTELSRGPGTYAERAAAPFIKCEAA